jgi:hypothetical protein
MNMPSDTRLVPIPAPRTPKLGSPNAPVTSE